MRRARPIAPWFETRTHARALSAASPACSPGFDYAPTIISPLVYTPAHFIHSLMFDFGVWAARSVAGRSGLFRVCARRSAECTYYRSFTLSVRVGASRRFVVRARPPPLCVGPLGLRSPLPWRPFPVYLFLPRRHSPPSDPRVDARTRSPLVPTVGRSHTARPTCCPFYLPTVRTTLSLTLCMFLVPYAPLYRELPSTGRAMAPRSLSAVLRFDHISPFFIYVSHPPRATYGAG